MLEKFKIFCEEYNHLQKSQIKQDLFVLFITKLKKNGFFVEFGACDGIELSNTFILEKKFGWDGILSEPSKGWHKALSKNRECSIDKNAVWKESNLELEFIEVKELNTLSGLNENNFTNSLFSNLINLPTSDKYIVNTISLKDLLIKYNAPKEIDYLSIDTEGTEFDIIENFDFNEYNIKIITIEYFTNKEDRDKIYNLLSKKGYQRVLTEISGQDDWYVKKI